MIEFNYMWDKKNYLEGSREAYNYEMKHSKKRLIGWFFIALTQFGVVAALKKNAFGLLFISTFLVVYWYFFRWKIREIMIAKTFKDKQAKKYNVKATSKDIEINNEKLNWSDFREIINLDKGFLLILDKSFLFFPKYAFKSIEDSNSFAKLAKENLKSYIKE